VLESATKLAERIGKLSDNAHERIRHAYLLTVSREPTNEELDRAFQFVEETQSILQDSKSHNASSNETIAWAGFCQSLIASSEFRYVN
jgi:hypothetical protein